MSTNEELEARMRPGGWSDGGFLGPAESLQAVTDHDEKLVAGLGLTHTRLASALKDVLVSATDLISTEHRKLAPRWLDPDISGPTASSERVRDLIAAHEAVSKPRIGVFEVQLRRYHGLQNCPWDECFRLNMYHGIFGAGFDWTVRRVDSGRVLSGPGMIVHLIERHHFFEGRQSPYRVDPRALAEMLGLA